MEILRAVSRAVWGAPTVAALMVCGAYLSWRCGFVQIRHFKTALRLSVGRIFKRGGPGSGTSALEAVCTALAGTVGTGNIAGVAVALTMGGPGAVFWMWVSALFGMGTKYAEITLAVRYRERRGGEYVGGPMYYIKNGLGPGCRWLAVLFAIFGAAAALGVGNVMQTGSILTVTGALGLGPAPAVGAAMALTVLLTCRGGAAGRGRAAAYLVPVMAGVYVLGTLTVIGANLPRLPGALAEIFAGALTPRAAVGGVSGFGAARAMSWGFRRGMFSNEAGLGSSPIAHASADVSSPAEQGLMGIFEVFVDTAVICTLTALAVLTSGVPIRYGVPGGAEYCAAAFAAVFGERASLTFMAAAMALFAFSSIVGWSLYGERCAQFLLGDRAAAVYRLAFAAVTFLGSLAPFTGVLYVCDIMNAMMALPNIPALLLLAPEAGRLTREFLGNLTKTGRQRQESMKKLTKNVDFRAVK